jgi:hypothetical protein
MKRQITLAVAILLGATTVFSQIKSDRPVGDITGVKIIGSGDLYLQQGESTSLSIDAQSQKDADEVKSEVKDGVLLISTGGSSGKVTLNLSGNTLKSIEIAGSADVHSKNKISALDLTLNNSGSGDMVLDLDAKQVHVIQHGSGDLILSGTANALDASLNGSGDLRAMKLQVGTAVVTTSGSGDARVNASQSLKATVGGSGDIVYGTEPKEKTVESSGSGVVRKTHSSHTSGKGNDTTKLAVGNKKVLICEGDDDEGERHQHHHGGNSSSNFKHWVGIDIGVNGLATTNNSLNLPHSADYMTLDYGKSVSFAINLMEKDFHLYHNYINLVTGLGFEFDHYSLQKNVSLRFDSRYTTATNSSPINYRKNNLNESLLTLPLMLEFNTSSNANKSVHFAIGMIGGWKIGAKTRQKYMDPEGRTIRVVRSNDYNLNPFRYSLTARAGFRNFTLFANYGLSDFFRAGKGPKLYPVSAGINIHLG